MCPKKLFQKKKKINLHENNHYSSIKTKNIRRELNDKKFQKVNQQNELLNTMRNKFFK